MARRSGCPQWNRDQTLATAFALSAPDRAVGIIQEIMIVNKSDGVVIRGKTGMGGPDNARLIWLEQILNDLQLF